MLFSTKCSRRVPPLWNWTKHNIVIGFGPFWLHYVKNDVIHKTESIGYTTYSIAAKG